MLDYRAAKHAVGAIIAKNANVNSVAAEAVNFMPMTISGFIVTLPTSFFLTCRVPLICRSQQFRGRLHLYRKATPKRYLRERLSPLLRLCMMATARLRFLLSIVGAGRTRNL